MSGAVDRGLRALAAREEVPFEAKVFRGKVGVLLALQLATLLASVTFAVDLHRLQSPLGTAQAWTEATVFGDCSRYLSLSVPADDQERRAPDQVCAALRRRSTATRTTFAVSRVTTRLLSRSARSAVVLAEVRHEGSVLSARLPLVRRDGDWRVVRDLSACRVGCG